MLPKFDESFDVVVIGYGFAGAVAAINAADAGARVLLAEKEPAPGGISICSYGAIRSAHSAADALAYLRATNAGRTPDDVLQALAEGMARVESEVRALAATSDAEILTRENGGNYPFPGSRHLLRYEHRARPRHDDPEALYPNLVGSGSANGWRVFKVLQDNIARRDITVRCGFPARRLVAGDDRAVRGVRFAGTNGSETVVEAKRGVVLACGGFEASAEMKQQYWEKMPVLSAATTSNTGDGIRMAQDLGAQLWHMWHFHGSYGFKHPDPRFADSVAIRAKRLPDWVPGEESKFTVKMSWIVVDQDGRAVHERVHAVHARHLAPADGVLRYAAAALSAHSVVSRVRRKRPQTLSGRRADVQQGGAGLRLERRQPARSRARHHQESRTRVAGLARELGCDPAALKATFKRWNALCAKGGDADFGRPPGSMVPLDTPPYYAGAV